MHNRVSRTITVLSILLALAGASVQAQSNSRLVANVPFKFVLAKRTLPAGKYSIQQMGTAGGRVLRIDNARGKNAGVILAKSLSSKRDDSTTQLVFRRYGDHYFLAEVWMSGEYRYELPKTKAEKEIAQSTKIAEPNLVSIELSRQ